MSKRFTINYDNESFDTIQVHGAVTYGPLVLDRSENVTIKGGFNCDYTDNSGVPTVIESMTIMPASGTVTLDNIAIE